MVDMGGRLQVCPSVSNPSVVAQSHEGRQYLAEPAFNATPVAPYCSRWSVENRGP
jgi:hypothetical protein